MPDAADMPPPILRHMIRCDIITIILSAVDDDIFAIADAAIYFRFSLLPLPPY
jgi:hypothetical protein